MCDTIFQMATQELKLPTEFTLEQIEELRMLAARANSVEPTPMRHNLSVKLAGYSADGQRALERMRHTS